MEHLELTVGDLTFDAVATGPPDGELVLLLHGFPESSWEWRSQLPVLADAGFRAVAPDQRGYSSRARPTGVGSYRAEHLVADAVGMVKELGASSCHLVGHDWGAVVAWLVASRHPELVKTLTAVSVPHPLAFAKALASTNDDQRLRSSYIRFLQQSEEPEAALMHDGGAGLRAWFTNIGLTDSDSVETYVKRMAEPGAMTAAINWYRAIDVRLIEDMGPISVPTLYVWSTDDIGIGREAAEATADYVAGPYRLEVLEGVSHWIPEMAADAFTPMLVDHLTGSTPPTPPTSPASPTSRSGG